MLKRRVTYRIGSRAVLALGGLAVAAANLAVPADAKPDLARTSGTSAPVVSADKVAAAIVDSRPAFLYASAHDEFVQLPVISSSGMKYAPFERTYRGLPVVGGDFVLVLDAAGRLNSSSVAQHQQIGDLSLTPTVTSANAKRVASGKLKSVSKVDSPELVVYALGEEPRLAYRATVEGVGAEGNSRLTVEVDAQTGAVLDTREGVLHGTGTGSINGPNPLSIATTHSGSTFSLRDPGTSSLRCDDLADGNATLTGPDDIWGSGDGADKETGCVDAVFSAQTMVRMLSTWLGRDGMDGNGGAWPIRVGMNEVNAEYNHNSQVQIGHNEDGKWLSSLDVVAHEFGHGIDDHTPGGISGPDTQEFVADVFGAATEWFANEDSAFDPPDFTVGEEVFATPFRYMYKPSIVPGDPDCYNFQTIGSLNVHQAAGVGNHWFYLLAEGTSPKDGQPSSPTCNGSSLQGIGVKDALKIFYNAMLMKNSNGDYGRYRVWTLTAARNLDPSCELYYRTRAAWDAVKNGYSTDEPGCYVTAAGSSDIAWHNEESGETQLWYLEGNKLVERGTVVDEASGLPSLAGPPNKIVAVGNLDGDHSDDDLVWHNSQTNEIQVWKLNGRRLVERATVVGQDGKPTHIGLPFSIVGVGDHDLDGNTDDLVWHNSQTNELQIWYLNDGKLDHRATVLGQDGLPTAVGPPFKIVGIGDFDGDGYSDLVWHNSQTNETQIWYLGDHELLRRVTVVGPDGRPCIVGSPFRIVGSGDVDSDGTADIVWHNNQTNETQIWYMNEHQLDHRETVVDQGGQAAVAGLPFSIVGVGNFA